jgi:hypothetical protein
MEKIIPPRQIARLGELTQRVFYLSQICLELMIAMQGQYEVRGNDAVLLERGRRPISPRSRKLYSRILRERLPELRSSLNELSRECPE